MSQLQELYKGLDFHEFKIKLATRPDGFMGDPATWDKAEAELASALEKGGFSFQYAPKEGAFYGPKIEIHLIDSLGRSWQCGTVQLDFSMPARFGLKYQGSDDKPHTPVMIHRAVLGSLERFIGILIEHFGGHFPLWLAPIQARVVNITEAQADYAMGVYREMQKAGLRVEFDDRREKLGFKIREAQLEKIPYMIVIGDKEMQSTTVAARYRDGKTLDPMSTADLIKHILHECGPNAGLVS
jgi:threonyl-tRNA synthetase